jgi:hypothetical protein
MHRYTMKHHVNSKDYVHIAAGMLLLKATLINDRAIFSSERDYHMD